MKSKLAFISIVPVVISAPLLAQDVRTGARPPGPAAVQQALEITLGAGYAQGFGDIGRAQRSLTDLSSAGGEITLGIGYRVDRNVLVGVYGSGSKYATGNFTGGADIWSATAGVQANLHFLPDNDWDPWIGLASGWRGHWVKRSSGTDSRHGWDIARLQIGVDYRVSPEFAIAPYVGAGVTMFFTQELASEQSFSNLNSPKANAWVSAGVQGRFDLFGKTGPSIKLASAD